MFGIILTISMTIGSGIIFYKYNNLLQNTLFASLYKLIYVFSFLQIKINKISNTVTGLIKIINPFITVSVLKEGDNISYSFITNKEYKYYKNGKQLLGNSNSEIDLVIIKDNETNLSLVIKGIEDLEPFLEESNVRFISVLMNYNGEKYKISLKTPEYNFYVVGNIIDKAFLQYYLVNVLQIELEEREIEYFLEIIDNDVNFIFLNEHQHILLKEDKYLLV